MNFITNNKTVTDNKLFWEVIKPSFSDKACGSENITLIENEEIINNEKEICEIFNNFFSDIVTTLNIPKIPCSVNVDSTDDTVSIAINKYKNHPIIKEIRNKTPISRKFAFQQVNREEVKL